MFTTDWFSHHIPTWSKLLARYRGVSGLRFLAVGAFEGRSAVWLAENVLTGIDCQLICCDPWCGPIPGTSDDGESVERRFEFNTRHVANVVGKLKSQATIALGKFIAARALFDVVYVDGDHYGPCVLADAVMAFQVLKPDGLMILDDYDWQMPGIRVPPKEAIDSFIAVFRELATFERTDCGQVVCRKRT